MPNTPEQLRAIDGALAILTALAPAYEIPLECVERLRLRWLEGPEEERGAEVRQVGDWVAAIGRMQVRGELARARYYREEVRAMLLSGRIVAPPEELAAAHRRPGLLARCLIALGEWQGRRRARLHRRQGQS